jgi:hypothetical protein
VVLFGEGIHNNGAVGSFDQVNFLGAAGGRAGGECEHGGREEADTRPLARVSFQPLLEIEWVILGGFEEEIQL